jgi:hypothetical protein
LLPDAESVTLQDSIALTIRPIRPDDARLLQRLLLRLSPKSNYVRFLGLRKALSDEEAEVLANVDYQRRMALVATNELSAGKNLRIRCRPGTGHCRECPGGTQRRRASAIKRTGAAND